jgi:hypothetical protein
MGIELKNPAKEISFERSSFSIYTLYITPELAPTLAAAAQMP